MNVVGCIGRRSGTEEEEYWRVMQAFECEGSECGVGLSGLSVLRVHMGFRVIVLSCSFFLVFLFFVLFCFVFCFFRVTWEDSVGLWGHFAYSTKVGHVHCAACEVFA